MATSQRGYASHHAAASRGPHPPRDARDEAAKAANIGFGDQNFWDESLTSLGLQPSATAVAFDNRAMTNDALLWFTAGQPPPVGVVGRETLKARTCWAAHVFSSFPKEIITRSWKPAFHSTRHRFFYSRLLRKRRRRQSRPLSPLHRSSGGLSRRGVATEIARGS
jgi:hypothetical protein